MRLVSSSGIFVFLAGPVCACVDGLLCECAHRWMGCCECVHRWMDCCMNAYIGGWVVVCTHQLLL